MKDGENTGSGLDVLRGGVNVEVEYKDPEKEPEVVFVREVTPDDVLEGEYVDLLRKNYPGLLDWICGREDGWSKTLVRKSWVALRKAEDSLNFEFALAETKAAHARGLRLKFIDEAINENAKELIRFMESVTSSRSTAGSRVPPVPPPAPSPSVG